MTTAKGLIHLTGPEADEADAIQTGACLAGEDQVNVEVVAYRMPQSVYEECRLRMSQRKYESALSFIRMCANSAEWIRTCIPVAK